MFDTLGMSYNGPYVTVSKPPNSQKSFGTSKKHIIGKNYQTSNTKKMKKYIIALKKGYFFQCYDEIKVAIVQKMI